MNTIETQLYTGKLVKNKEGLIYQEPVCRYRNNDLSKRWYVEYKVVNSNNKLIRYQSYGKVNYIHNVKLRTIALNKLSRELSSYLKKMSPTNLGLVRKNQLKDDISDYLDHIKATKRERTFVNYKAAFSILSNYLDEYGIYDVSNMQGDTLILYQRWLQKQGKSNNTSINHKIIVTTAFIKWAIKNKNGYHSGLYERVSKLEEATVVKNKTYTKKQREKINSYYLENGLENMYLMAQFIYYSFMRPSHILSLKVEDIDLEKNLIRIKGENSKDKKNRYQTLVKPLKDILVKFVDFKKPYSYLLGNPKDKWKPSAKGSYNNAYLMVFVTHVRNHLNFPKEYTMYSNKHTGAMAVYGELRKEYSVLEAEIKLQSIIGHSSLESTRKYIRERGAEAPEDWSHLYID